MRPSNAKKAFTERKEKSQARELESTSRQQVAEDDSFSPRARVVRVLSQIKTQLERNKGLQLLWAM